MESFEDLLNMLERPAAKSSRAVKRHTSRRSPQKLKNQKLRSFRERRQAVTRVGR